MPVRNGERHLASAVESILDQTFGDLELIAVDDGSSDGTRDILDAYQRDDSRVRVLQSDTGGFVAAVTVGVDASVADWIARMDADDVSQPDRLRAQWTFLTTHRDVSLLGTTAEVIDDDGSPRSVIRYPAHDAVIRLALRSSTTFAHGSVIMRRDVLTAAGGYRSGCFPAEDYDLWCRMAIGGATAANLDAPLYRYRLSSGGISRTQITAQLDAAEKVGRAYGRSTVALPSLRAALRAVREIDGDVRGGKADPRALRRTAASLVECAPRWVRERPAAAAAALGAASDAELRYRLRRRRAT